MKYSVLPALLCLLLWPAPAPCAQQSADGQLRQSGSFTAWKLEAYRRRDVAWNFSLADSVFAYSIRGQRSALTHSRQQTEPASARWQECPAGFRSGSLRISLELPAEHPSALTIRLQNRSHELIAERTLTELHAGRNDLEFQLDEDMARAGLSNPGELLISLPADSPAGHISSIQVDGLCQVQGWHRFADFDTAALELEPGRRIILF